MDLSGSFTTARLQQFAAELQELAKQIDFKVSSRGWCYLLEQARVINKNQFARVDAAISKARKAGFLPVDFVADEEARGFAGVERETPGGVISIFRRNLADVLDGSDYYTPDWWRNEEYYVQMVVEKVDLKTLFEPIAREYHIPIANAKGWSSILQRATYARRFKEAEERGLNCVLLYCGDHDPDGLRISDTLRKNLEDIQSVQWEDGETGYSPVHLKIVRFGLNYDFIQAQGYTWIDNLITSRQDQDGKARDLSDPKHKNNKYPYVQNYLRNYGARKCEANAVVTTPDAARQLVRNAIEQILGTGARERFAALRDEVEAEYAELLEETGLAEAIEAALDSQP